MTKVCLGKISFGSLPTLMYGPMDEEDAKILGEPDKIIFDYKKGRSAGNHKRYFAFINHAFGMQDHFDNQEVFRSYLQVKAGHFVTVISPANGKTQYWPKSVAWDALDEEEFRKLFNEVVNAFLAFYGHKLDQDQINFMAGF
jgi:hypothetical protein